MGFACVEAVSNRPFFILKNLLVQKKAANRQMIKKKYIYWQDDDMWLGYLEEYPDYWTQGETEEELRENLLDIYSELTSGNIQNIRRVAELEVS